MPSDILLSHGRREGRYPNDYESGTDNAPAITKDAAEGLSASQKQKMRNNVSEDRAGNQQAGMSAAQIARDERAKLAKFGATKEENIADAIEHYKNSPDSNLRKLAAYADAEGSGPKQSKPVESFSHGDEFDLGNRHFRVEVTADGGTHFIDTDMDIPHATGDMKFNRGSLVKATEPNLDEPFAPPEKKSTTGQGSLLGERYEGSNIGSKTGNMFGDTSRGAASGLEAQVQKQAAEAKANVDKDQTGMFEKVRQDNATITGGKFKGATGKVKNTTTEGAASITFTDANHVERTMIFPKGQWEKTGAAEPLGFGKGKMTPPKTAEMLSGIDPRIADKFLKQDVIPKAHEVATTVAQAAKDIQRLLAPQTQGPKAELAAGIAREHGAELAQRSDRAQAALAKARGYFDQQDNETNLDFMDAMEHGQAFKDTGLQRTANVLRDLLDGRRQEVQALGKGKLEHFIEDYFPHIWKDPEKAASIFAQVFSKRPLEGGKSFLKQRTIPTIRDGIKAGLEPASYNPVDMALLKIREMDRYILGQRMLAELKAKGLAKFVSVNNKAPEGYGKIDDNLARVYGPPTIGVKEHVDQAVYEGLVKTAESLGISHERLAKLKGRALGLSYPGQNKIQSEFATETSVIAHEIGHQLDEKYNLWENVLKKDSGKGFDKGRSELRNIADMTGSRGGNVRSKEEKIAQMMEAYIHAPEKMNEVAPNVYEWFDRFIHTHPELKPFADIKPGIALKQMKTEVAHGGLLKMGEYHAPQEAADVLNNYLSPGLRGKSALFRGALTAGNVLNQAQLGLSAFHLGFTSLDAATSKFAIGLNHLADGNLAAAAKSIAGTPLAPLTTFLHGNKVLREWYKPGSQGAEIAQIVDAMKAAGGRAQLDQTYRTGFLHEAVKAFRQGNVLGGLLRTPFAGLELAAKPIMEYIVPRQKMGVFLDMARREIQKTGATNRDQVRAAMGKAWDSVDNRMGQLVYDNLFWNRTAKDLGQASVRSLGWNLGTIRELGGGVYDALKAGKDVATLKKPEVTYRMAYVAALPMVTGMIGASLQYLMTGKGPDELKDYFFPKTGEQDDKGRDNRLALPSYMKDVYAYAHDPMGTLGHKVHPDLSILADMLQNKDFYGDQIRNVEDPFIKQLQDTAGYAGKQLVPLGVRNAQQGKTLADKTLPFVGLTPASKWLSQTAMGKVVAELRASSGISFSSTPEDKAMFERRKPLLAQYRATPDPLAAINADELKLSGADAKYLREHAMFHDEDMHTLLNAPYDKMLAALEKLPRDELHKPAQRYKADRENFMTLLEAAETRVRHSNDLKGDARRTALDRLDALAKK